MSQLYAHVHLFCFLLVSNVPVRQFIPDGPHKDGTPIIRKGAAFIYNYQAVISENETKVRVFSPFPQPPPVDLTAVSSLIDLVSNIPDKLTSLPFLQTVAFDEPCPIAMYTSQDRAHGLRECIEYRVHLLPRERWAIAKMTLKYYTLHLPSLQPQWSLLLLVLLIIDNDDLFPHSWQPPVSLVLFWETRYEMLPAKPFSSLAYAVTTPFLRILRAIYSSVRLPSSKVSIVSKKRMKRNCSFWAEKSLTPRKALKTYETLSMPV